MKLTENKHGKNLKRTGNMILEGTGNTCNMKGTIGKLTSNTTLGSSTYLTSTLFSPSSNSLHVSSSISCKSLQLFLFTPTTRKFLIGFFPVPSNILFIYNAIHVSCNKHLRSFPVFCHTLISCCISYFIESEILSSNSESLGKFCKTTKT